MDKRSMDQVSAVQRRTLLLGLGALVLSPACRRARPEDAIGIGSELVFHGRDLRGDGVALSDFRGKLVIVNLWATWCPPCIKEMPLLDGLARQYQDVHTVFISQDTAVNRVKVEALAKRMRIQSTMLLDPAGRAATRLAATGYPTTVMLDHAGIVRWRRTGQIQHDDSEFEGALARLRKSPPQRPPVVKSK